MIRLGKIHVSVPVLKGNCRFDQLEGDYLYGFAFGESEAQKVKWNLHLCTPLQTMSERFFTIEEILEHNQIQEELDLTKDDLDSLLSSVCDDLSRNITFRWITRDIIQVLAQVSEDRGFRCSSLDLVSLQRLYDRDERVHRVVDSKLEALRRMRHWEVPDYVTINDLQSSYLLALIDQRVDADKLLKLLKADNLHVEILPELRKFNGAWKFRTKATIEEFLLQIEAPGEVDT